MRSSRASAFVSRALGARIVVPVARPASLQSLLPIAAAVAAGDDGHVVPLTVIPPRSSSRQVQASADLAVEAERRLRAEGISASGVVAEADEVADGIRAVVAAEAATLVVMGWRGGTEVSQAFDATVDDVVGRSSVPLLVVRPSDRAPQRVVVPLTAAHVTPAAKEGLVLATTVACRLRAGRGLDVSVLWAGSEPPTVPDEVRSLTDRLHHDPSRLDQAVGAMARPGDVVVASVAPTATGLRDVTTHLSAATPDAALVVAIDPARRRPGASIGREVADAVTVRLDDGEVVDHLVTVTIEPSDGATVSRRRVVRALAHLGTVSDVDVQWHAATRAQRLRVVVRVAAAGPTAALGEVMAAMHDSPAFVGASLHYEVVRPDTPVRLDRLEPLGNVEP